MSTSTSGVGGGANARDDSALVVNRMYVIRRKLGKSRSGIPVDLGVVAHSALLLQTGSNRYFVLEYMANSNVYTTETTVEVIKTFPDKSYAYIAAKGHDGTTVQTYYWTRQLKGTQIDAKLALTPKQLAAMMGQVMKSGYSVLGWEVCHTAQERLRNLLKSMTTPAES